MLNISTGDKGKIEQLGQFSSEFNQCLFSQYHGRRKKEIKHSVQFITQ